MRKCTICGGEVEYINNQIVKCKYCGKLYSLSGDTIVEANVENMYRDACDLALATAENSVQTAISLFEALGSYKDSANKVVECRRRIEHAKAAAEDRRLEEKRRAELEEIERKKREYQEKQKKRIVTIVGVSAAAICVIVIAIVGSASIRKRAKYNEAVALYEKENYEEAMDVFAGLKDYSDSEGYVEKISELLTDREEVYSRAKNYYDNEQYGEAIAEFSKYSSYLDSQDYMDKSSEKIYEEAKAAFDAEETKKAQELLMTIPQGTSAYNNALVLLSDVNEAVQEQENARKYEQAIEALDNEQYESAQELFISLGDYQNSKEYVSNIGSALYEQAQVLFESEDYPHCGEVLEKIDTIEEWEAKNICRSDGYSAMAEYVEKMVCCLLSEDELKELKEEATIHTMKLTDMEPYLKKGFLEKDYNREDNFGNIYAVVLHCGFSRNQEHSYTYEINGKYKYLNATVAISKYGYSGFDTGIIEIYGDDNLLWSDTTIGPAKKPYPIQVDISDVIDLRIEIYGKAGFNITPGDPFLCDPILSE